MPTSAISNPSMSSTPRDVQLPDRRLSGSAPLQLDQRLVGIGDG